MSMSLRATVGAVLAFVAGLYVSLPVAIAKEHPDKILKSVGDLVITASAAAGAYAALAGLRTWRAQARAARLNDLLDQVVETAWRFVEGLAIPLQNLEHQLIAFETYTHTASLTRDLTDEGKLDELGLSIPGDLVGIATYIKRRGKEESQRLFAQLRETEPDAARLRLLAAKVAAQGLSEAEDLSGLCVELVSVHRQLSTFAFVLDSGSLAFSNESVAELVRINAKTDANAIRDLVNARFSSISQHATARYKELL